MVDHLQYFGNPQYHQVFVNVACHVRLNASRWMAELLNDDRYKRFDVFVLVVSWMYSSFTSQRIYCWASLGKSVGSWPLIYESTCQGTLLFVRAGNEGWFFTDTREPSCVREFVVGKTRQWHQILPDKNSHINGLQHLIYGMTPHDCFFAFDSLVVPTGGWKVYGA